MGASFRWHSRVSGSSYGSASNPSEPARLRKEERRLEARGLAILLYPELVHLEIRLARARNEEVVDGPLIETPVHVLSMANRLHVMGPAGDLLLELLASLSVNQQLVAETQTRIIDGAAASAEDSRRHVRERLERAAGICTAATRATLDLIESRN
jgi:hypothetical protein